MLLMLLLFGLLSLLFVTRRGADFADAPALRAPASFSCEPEGC